MSADSTRRAGSHRGAQVVSPQPVSEGSIIESMAGIINDIVPQVNITILINFYMFFNDRDNCISKLLFVFFF